MNLLEPITWAILLMLFGCCLAVAEVFVPSGGILGVLASIAVFTSIGMAFYHHGATTGLAFSCVAVILLPASMALGFKFWPHTPLGRRMLQAPPSEEEVLPDSEERRQLKALLGKIGKAHCDMLPAGAIQIDGHTIDAISQGMPIDAGQTVKVVEVRANRVVVRPLRAGEELARRDPEDVLSQPIESLGLDALEDPLA